jgi:hypothetical protein
VSPPAVFYRYSPDRKGEHPQDFLKDGSGYMHADAYAGYNPLYEPDPITKKAQFTEVACWAHGRRKIYDVYVQTASPAASRRGRLDGRPSGIDSGVHWIKEWTVYDGSNNKGTDVESPEERVLQNKAGGGSNEVNESFV